MCDTVTPNLLMLLCYIITESLGLAETKVFMSTSLFFMSPLRNILQRCHRRYEKPLRQRKTVITPALYKRGYPFLFTVYCAHKYPVVLADLERADISFMPIGRAPGFDRGPNDFGGERFLKRQDVEDWRLSRWYASWGIQMYTGIPSGREGAQWHDLDFTYQAICAAPDAVFACIEALVSVVANPLLTLSESGGLRFSCRVPDYLHPNTEQERLYIYKHVPTAENPHQGDVYLEIFGEEGYSRWDARYEILLGDLLNPPMISKEVLFAPIDALRDVLHEPTPLGEKSLKLTSQIDTRALLSLGSYNLDLAKEAFVNRDFSYLHQDDSFHYWTPPGSEAGNASVLLWESGDTVWVRASAPNAGLPTRPTSITDVWDDTGILPPIPATGMPVSDKVLAVREGKLSPLVIKRPDPMLQKSEQRREGYKTRQKKPVQPRSVFDATARIREFIVETSIQNNSEIESYLLNGGAICLNVPTVELGAEVERHYQELNLPSVARWKPRMHLWDQVKDIPIDVRMATPFQRGNVCEDPERCDALEEKGGDPSESICPQCPVYTECQQHGYLSQPLALQRSKVQIVGLPQLFLNPQYAALVEQILEQLDETKRFCIIDQAHAYKLFLGCNVSKSILEEWSVSWRGSALGNFARALLNALEIKGPPDGNFVKRIRAVVQAFQQQEEALIRQMRQVNIRGKVVARGVVDTDTGRVLARFRIEFEGGASAYIPLDTDARDKLIAKGLAFFSLPTFVINEDMKIPMSISKAIELGILNTETVEAIQALPSVYREPDWTLWHQLKRFFAYYTHDANALMHWDKETLKFSVPPILHACVKRLLLISTTLPSQHLRRVFPDAEIEIVRPEPTAWVAGNRVFQIRTGIYSRQTILNYGSNWDVIGMSKTGLRFFSGIRAEIERDPSVKHAIITYRAILRQLERIAEKENVCFVTDFKETRRFESAFEAAEVIWMVGVPVWSPSVIRRRSQILFGNDKMPLSYDEDTASGCYKDDRVQSVYEQDVIGFLTRIVGRAKLNRLGGKRIMLLTSLKLPEITDRAETLLFDWEDFEVTGRLDELAEVIATRQRFETDRANLTAESSRDEVSHVLGVSKSQANRVLQKLRGGKLRPVSFREQILTLLTSGDEKKTAELVASIEGHPKAINNELTRLVDAGEIVKIRRGVYSKKSKP